MPGGEHGSAAGTCSRSQPQRLDGVARPAFDGNRQHGRYTVVNPRERDWRAGAARGDGAGVSQGGRLTAAPQPPVSASCQAGHPRAAVPPPVTHRPAERLPLNPSDTLLPPLPGPRLDRLSRFLCRAVLSRVFSLTLRHRREGGGREGEERGDFGRDSTNVRALPCDGAAADGASRELPITGHAYGRGAGHGRAERAEPCLCLHSRLPVVRRVIYRRPR